MSGLSISLPVWSYSNYHGRLLNTLQSLNKIAVDNNGNRAFGFPGFNASINYILERMRCFDDHFDTVIQPFTHLFSITRNISLTGPDGENVEVISLHYNQATALPGGVTAPLAALPVDDERGSGCFDDQWVDDVTGKIVLVKRGKCQFADKLKLAKDKGALAAIIWNNDPSQKGGSASLGAENVGKLAPVGVVSYDQGVAWLKRIDDGETLVVNLIIDAMAEERETWQVISETKEGDPNNIILLGAHLDSVQEGAGINDNGSGTAALLEIAASFSKYTFKNKVRFAWWGAEESGLIGSIYYASQLSEEAIDNIRFYFNYDMIASPQPSYLVYADSDAHKAGGGFLYNYLIEQGYPAEYAYVLCCDGALTEFPELTVTAPSRVTPTMFPFLSLEYPRRAFSPAQVPHKTRAITPLVMTLTISTQMLWLLIRKRLGALQRRWRYVPRVSPLGNVQA